MNPYLVISCLNGMHYFVKDFKTRKQAERFAQRQQEAYVVPLVTARAGKEARQ